MNKRVLALGRMKAGQMNRTEAAYATALEAARNAHEIVWYAFEGVTLKLADGCRYTPDFAVLRADGVMEMHEVKSYWIGDAKTKVKVAAEKFPFVFKAVYKQAKKDGGGWRIEEL